MESAWWMHSTLLKANWQFIILPISLEEAENKEYHFFFKIKFHFATNTNFQMSFLCSSHMHKKELFHDIP